jgi:redox-sensitive bicupin YhaK (pirin superfamily)
MKALILSELFLKDLMTSFRRVFLKRALYGIFGISIFGTIMKKINRSKKVKFSYTVDQKHWVGNAFNVHGLLRPSEELNSYISPFILMDYASPKEFSKTETPRGVGEHPHRGFETVTFAYQGEVQHRDSAGGGGIIKPGDVQWMTAGSGIVHDEFQSEDFSKEGGTFEMVQLWVNLPKKDKMTAPKYQSIKKEEIPTIKLSKNSELRIIAGEFEGTKGPSSTFTPINIFDLKAKEDNLFSFNLKNGSNTVLLILKGEVHVDLIKYNESSVLIFDHDGDKLDFKTSSDFKGLLLNGTPIDEPMVAHGPFVMNSREEISQALKDYQNGKMGKL